MIYSNDRGEYTCSECGHTWKARSRYLWWPVRILWADRKASRWFARHGWHVAFDGIEQRVYGQTFHFGRLKVCFGREHTTEGAT